MISSYYFGHKIYYDLYKLTWYYCDNHVLVDSETRKCPRCDQYQTKEGYDPCQGYIKGASSVCCGHGIHEPILIK